MDGRNEFIAISDIDNYFNPAPGCGIFRNGMQRAVYGPFIHRHSVNDFLRDPGSQHEVASYIAAMTKELAALASGREMPLLRYLLEMAQDEALAISRQSPEPGAMDDALR